VARTLEWPFRRLRIVAEIRRGRFVDGFLGEQFALPAAVESVRALRKLDSAQGNDYAIGGGSAEPGGNSWFPGDRVPAISGNSVTFP